MEGIIHIFLTIISSLDFLLKHFTPTYLLKKYGYNDSTKKVIKWLTEQATFASNGHNVDLKTIFYFLVADILAELGFKTFNNSKFHQLAIGNYAVQVSAKEREWEGVIHISSHSI